MEYRESTVDLEYVRDPPKRFCAVSYVKVFAETTVTDISRQDMFENYLMPQLEKDMNRDFIF
jgi:hypothetical protein